MPDDDVRVSREDGFTSVGGTRIHYEVHGQGDPVVLVHGLGASAASWRLFAPHLAEAGYRVFALDLKGCGLSARGPGDYSRRALANLVSGFMDNLGIRRARAIVGHSMGGAIALDLAATRPERLDLVCVIDGQGVVTPPWILQAVAPVTPLFGSVISGMSRFSPLAPRRFVARSYLRKIFADPMKVTDEIVDAYAAFADPGYQRAMFAMMQHLGDTRELATGLRKLKVPACLIWGKQDLVCPLEFGEELARELPDSELHVLDGCGHCPPEEHPVESAAILIDFLARRAPSPEMVFAARAAAAPAVDRGSGPH